MTDAHTAPKDTAPAIASIEVTFHCNTGIDGMDMNRITVWRATRDGARGLEEVRRGNVVVDDYHAGTRAVWVTGTLEEVARQETAAYVEAVGADLTEVVTRVRYK